MVPLAIECHDACRRSRLRRLDPRGVTVVSARRERNTRSHAVQGGSTCVRSYCEPWLLPSIVAALVATGVAADQPAPMGARGCCCAVKDKADTWAEKTQAEGRA